ncbi:hypothetical protein LguiA_012031 [Lonicera macranthoides]
MDQIKASMENGVLTITIPKEELKKADVIYIKISDMLLVFSSSILRFMASIKA